MSCLLLVVASGSSIIDIVFGVLSFFLLPFVDVLRSNKPSIIVLQIITLSGLRFFISHKVIQVVFPSFGWSFLLSCQSLSTGPSVRILGWRSASLVAISSSSVFQPNLRCCMSAFFISIFRASFYAFNPVF